MRGAKVQEKIETYLKFLSIQNSDVSRSMLFVLVASVIDSFFVLQRVVMRQL